MRVEVTVAVTGDDGITHTYRHTENSWPIGDRPETPASTVKHRVIRKIRQALDTLVDVAGR